MIEVQKCPPMPSYSLLPDDPVFKRNRPVLLHDHDKHGNRKNATQLSTADICAEGTMQVHGNGKGGLRNKPIYPWMQSTECLRQIVLIMVEMNAYYGRPRSRNAEEVLKFTPWERIERANKFIRARRGKSVERLEQLCHAFVASKNIGDIEEQKRLGRNIGEMDARLRHSDDYASLVASVLYLSWRMGVSSSAVAALTNGAMSPTSCRQLLHRARKIGCEIFMGKYLAMRDRYVP